MKGALLSKKTGKPVMLRLTRQEEFTTTRTRSACVFETKTGVKKDGTFTARYIKAIVDMGAYAHGSLMADRAQFYWSTLDRNQLIVIRHPMNHYQFSHFVCAMLYIPSPCCHCANERLKSFCRDAFVLLGNPQQPEPPTDRIASCS